MERAVPISPKTLHWGLTAYVATFACRVDAIAQPHGWPVDTWQEDGLGPQRGLFLQLPSGVAMELSEDEHAMTHLGVQGATCSVPREVFRARGSEDLLREILPALGIDAALVAHRSSEEQA